MSKKKSREEQIEDVQSKLEAIKLKKLELAQKRTSNKVEEKDFREEFKVWWASNRKKFNKEKEIEHILWVHLKATKHDVPEKFEAGIKHFGLKQVN